MSLSSFTHLEGIQFSSLPLPPVDEKALANGTLAAIIIVCVARKHTRAPNDAMVATIDICAGALPVES